MERDDGGNKAATPDENLDAGIGVDKAAAVSEEKPNDAAEAQNGDEIKKDEEPTHAAALSSDSTASVVDGLSAMWSSFSASIASTVAGAVADGGDKSSNSGDATTREIGESTKSEKWDLAALGNGVREQLETATRAATEAVASIDAKKIQHDAEQLLHDASAVMSDPVKDNASELKAPWEMLGEDDQKYADAMRDALLKMTVDCVYSKEQRVQMFLGGVESTHMESFEITPENERRVRGAVLHDANLSRLFAGLVPRHIKHEEVFWGRYFYHVDRIHKSLVLSGQSGGGGGAAAGNGDAAASDAVVGGANGKSSGQGGAENADAGGNAQSASRAKGVERDWDKEIDEIF